jgi:hypothetical protein
MAAKCRALLLYRLHDLGTKKGSPTALWLRRWGLIRPSANPPNYNKRLEKFEYLQHWEMDSADVSPRVPEETGKAYRRRIYTILATLLQAEPNEKGIRIEKRWPDTNWSMVWGNLWATPVPDSTKDAWYRVMHDIVATRERLHAIRLAQTELCRMCQVKDTLTHRITGCDEANG